MTTQDRLSQLWESVYEFDKVLSTITPMVPPLTIIPQQNNIIPSPTFLMVLPKKCEINGDEKKIEYINNPNLVENFNTTRIFKPYENYDSKMDTERVKTIFSNLEEQIVERVFPHLIKRGMRIPSGDLSEKQWELLKSKLQPWIQGEKRRSDPKKKI